jgi:hypothetical protein
MTTADFKPHHSRGCPPPRQSSGCGGHVPGTVWGSHATTTLPKLFRRCAPMQWQEMLEWVQAFGLWWLSRSAPTHGDKSTWTQELRDQEKRRLRSESAASCDYSIALPFKTKTSSPRPFFCPFLIKPSAGIPFTAVSPSSGQDRLGGRPRQLPSGGRHPSQRRHGKPTVAVPRDDHWNKEGSKAESIRYCTGLEPGSRRSANWQPPESDSDDAIDRSGNRGYKLKKRARFTRQGQLAPPSGPQAYKEVSPPSPSPWWRWALMRLLGRRSIMQAPRERF